MNLEDSNLLRVANLEVVLRRLDGDVDLLRELVALYIDDYPAQLQKLLDAVAADDMERIHRIAHKLKGTAWSFAAESAAEAARRLEETKEITDGKDAAELAQLLSHELSRLHLALEEFLIRA